MNAKTLLSSRDINQSNRSQFPVLVIDDDPVFQSLISHYLEGTGYEVEVCDSAENGLLMLADSAFKLVISDWNFPGMTGLEFCRQVRLTEDEYHYILFLTGNTSDECLDAGFRHGADDYIRKGARKAEIIARLDAGLRILQQQSELVRQRQEIERQAVTDVLTGCFNRRYLMNVGENELKRASRYKQELSVLIADIDFFKKINDEYGHQAGDFVLAQCGQLVTALVRQDVDIPCRYGGEEFVILLPSTNHDNASLVAEKLRHAIEEKEFTWKDQLIKVTCSFGVATCNPDQSTSLDGLLSEADLRLYQSKEDGRNCVTGA